MASRIVADLTVLGCPLNLSAENLMKPGKDRYELVEWLCLRSDDTLETLWKKEKRNRSLQAAAKGLVLATEDSIIEKLKWWMSMLALREESSAGTFLSGEMPITQQLELFGQMVEMAKISDGDNFNTAVASASDVLAEAARLRERIFAAFPSKSLSQTLQRQMAQHTDIGDGDGCVDLASIREELDSVQQELNKHEETSGKEVASSEDWISLRNEYIRLKDALIEYGKVSSELENWYMGAKTENENDQDEEVSSIGPMSRDALAAQKKLNDEIEKILASVVAIRALNSGEYQFSALEKHIIDEGGLAETLRRSREI